MIGPSIKGIAFQSLLDDVKRLVQTGKIAQDELTSSLKPEDLEYLDEPVLPTLWYPIDVFDRYLELLWRVDGGSREEYLVRRGAAAAERIFASGTYADLMATAEKWGGNQIAMALIGLSSQLHNFTRWQLVGNFDDDEFDIEVCDAKDYPEVARLTGQGFIEKLYSRSSNRDLTVTSRRPSSDRVLFHVEVCR
jgi:hypothetical protein